MTFKKSIALLLSGSMLAAAALTGCGSDNTAAAVSNTAGKDLLDQIQARGSITVAMEGTWAPWTYHDENDELVGYDVEVAKLIANELGVDGQLRRGRMGRSARRPGRRPLRHHGKRRRCYTRASGKIRFFPYLMPIIKLLSSSAATTTKFIPWRI